MYIYIHIYVSIYFYTITTTHFLKLSKIQGINSFPVSSSTVIRGVSLLFNLLQNNSFSGQSRQQLFSQKPAKAKIQIKPKATELEQ